MPDRETSLPRISRLLDDATRAWWFEPAYYDALQAHLEAQAGRGAAVRALAGMAFFARVHLLAIECLRLSLSSAAPDLSSPLASQKGDGVMALLWQDLKYALRGLRKTPGFAFVAVLTLALGIGANTAIFTVVNSTLLRPLPYRDAGRLVALWGINANTKSDRDPLAPDTVKDYFAQIKSFQEIAAFSPRWSFSLLGDGEPQRVFGYFASASAFPMLGVQPARGRFFTAQEDAPNGPPVILISYRLWQNRYGGRDDVLGKSVRLDAAAATIIGVLPPDFQWQRNEGDIWAPVQQNPIWGRGRVARLFEVVGRLAPGTNLQQAQAEVQTIASALAAQYPSSYKGITARLTFLQEDIVGAARAPLMVLLGAVGLVLLVACANVANLVLARASGRFRQVAIRAALGANRGRILRELLTESGLLALAGGAAGIALAAWGVRALVALAPAGLPRRDEIAMDATALLFTLGVAAFTGMLCGLVPAWQAWRLNLTGALKEGGRGGDGTGRQRMRAAFVVAEVALSVVVVCGATLLVRSFIKLQSVDPGFQTENIVSLDLSGIGQDAAQRMAAMEALYRRLSELPGVVAAGEVSRVPLAGVGGNPTTKFQVEGRQEPVEQLPEIDFRRASREYFRTIGIPLLSGRMFTERDALPPAPAQAQSAAQAAPPAAPQLPAVMLINKAAAELLFPGEDPIGKRMTMTGGSLFEIIGVVGNIHHVGLSEKPRPDAYMHTLQGPLVNPQLIVRTANDAASMTNAIRQTIRQAIPEAIVDRVTTMEQVRYQSLAVPRFNTLLFACFSVLALVLALVGTYGVMAYNVAQRRQEIGIRMTLGAQPGDVLRMVLGSGMKLAGAGIALGIAGALAATRGMRAMLFEVDPADPLSFAAVAGLLLLVAAAACIVPALRASRVDPLVALRYE